MNRRDYISRINKVMNYIDNHLEEDLSLASLSRIAAFSPFHFHRIFKAIVGENVNEFVKRIRIEKSAHYLENRSDLSITDIASACGFTSLSTFSRAFSEHFEVSARDYRKNRQHSKNSQVYRKKGQEVLGVESYSEYVATGVSDQMSVEQVRIERLPELHVAYVRNRFGFSKGIFSKEIVDSFSKTEAWLRQNNLDLRKSIEIGITYDNPDITENEKCRYDAAFTIPAELTDSLDHEEVGIQDVPGGLYAVYTIRLTNVSSEEEVIAQLGHVVDYMYGRWLPDSDYLLANRPCLEIYHTELQGAVVILDFCLPVEKG
ncbi:AraC family transcriptional regulator [Cohnella abietis]|uniref:AraC family transcriptional regulator n=1 Tax=Cohnella abietis TaxID=2507935 RepID=A0A3T1CY94_9BACL|nr:GyrI-like domain-containing protein [Cohnella abietis]BBI30832.1 AraC family transcriptional regulator [Cohnella abietis]